MIGLKMHNTTHLLKREVQKRNFLNEGILVQGIVMDVRMFKDDKMLSKNYGLSLRDE